MESAQPTVSAAPSYAEENVSQETTVLSNNPYAESAAQMYNAEQNAADNFQPVYTESTNSQSTYTQTYEEPVEKESKIFGLIGMICGIASILCCVAGPVLAIPGVILSIVGMVKKEKKTFPIVGIITSALGFIIGIIVIAVLIYAANEM